MDALLKELSAQRPILLSIEKLLQNQEQREKEKI